MRNNNNTSLIIVMGIIVVLILSGIMIVNILPNNESNPYYAKFDSKMVAEIEELSVDDIMLTIKTTNDTVSFCVKRTITTPTLDSICWLPVENNYATISLYKSKSYYVWIKDSKNNISSYKIINT